MTKLPELFEEALSAAPPSRLTADDIFDATRARRRQRTAVAAGLAVVFIGVAGVAGVSLTGRHSANPPAGTAPPGPLVWAAQADADHLYALVNVCGHNPRVDPTVPNTAIDLGTDAPSGAPPTAAPTPTYQEPPVCNRLLASSDGGATWVSRGLTNQAEFTVVGPTSLLRLHVRLATGRPRSRVV
jgi:hypothetical protein